MSGASAELSVVVVSPRDVRAVRRTITHLRRQTVRERIEVVVVACGGGTSEAALDGNGFAATRLVDGRKLRTTGEAIAAGMRAASAPLVGCVEEHSFPQPDWGAAVIDAHSGGWAAVAGVLENANPTTRTSWAGLFNDFGPSVAPAAGGEATELAAHHTVYKRAALQRYGERLGRFLEVEWVLHDDLRAAGEQLFREPRAVSHHINASRFSSFLGAELNGGRAFAANRAELRNWGPLRRLVWTAGSVLTPIVRFARARGHVDRCRAAAPSGVGLVVLAGLVANAVGQMLGYGAGPGRGAERRMAIELRREDYLRREERDQLVLTPLEDLPRLCGD